MNMAEEWKNVVGYETLFRISSHGNLFSCRTNKILKTHINKEGYVVCCVSLGSRSNKKLLRMHVLVAKCFIGNPENKPQVNHIDGIKLNNHYSNLEWVTSKENIKHAYDTGLMCARVGLDNKLSKLTLEELEYIDVNYIPKDRIFGSRALGRSFNITHGNLLRALNNYRVMKSL
jgi:hypothetical protein